MTDVFNRFIVDYYIELRGEGSDAVSLIYCEEFSHPLKVGDG